MTHRIGLMGGMFDPIHRGHLQLAMAALQTLHLDQIRLVPCSLPNHRETPIASPPHRLAMLRAATAEVPALQVDDVEIRRGGTSYTIDTLAYLHAEFPGHSLVCLLGMDAFLSLPHWHRWQELLEQCHFLVATRPGYTPQPGSIMAQELAAREVDSESQLFEYAAGRVMVYPEMNSTLSSTAVREAIAAGDAISHLVPEVVERYLLQNDLYRPTL
jgi:nicotinate-nucleotide adenylyltransferase